MKSINYLRERGLRVEIAGSKLRLSPKEKITPDIDEFARTHKGQIIAELKAEIESMTLDNFSKATLAIRIHSKVLDEYIWLCSDAIIARLIEKEGDVAYLPCELLSIHEKRLAPNGIRMAHKIKASFKGQIR